MNRLERLGLEVVAFTLLGSRAQAAALLALYDAGGRFVHWATLSAACPWRMAATEASEGAIKTRVCLLRAALTDIGLPDVIKSAGRKEGVAYALPEPGRSALLNRLMMEAA